MKWTDYHYTTMKKIFTLAAFLMLAATLGCAASGGGNTAPGQASVMQPMEIPEKATCGKCGMYPASYPRWQSQIIFKDGAMTPFDGCKCMFNFLFAMDKFDKTHSRDDVAIAWVKDFNTGAWLDATAAYYVVGSDMMGPMGKELIPFAEQAEAAKFHQEQGGAMMRYADINPEVMKTLGMGGMKMQQGGHMKM